LRTAENRDAVSAAVQNVLLGATALGLASFWSSCPTGANDEVAKFCGFPSGTTIVAMIYLGWPTDVPKGFERPAPRITQRS
jgi:nitroreductase